MKIALTQMETVWENPAANQAEVRRLTALAKAAGIAVIVVSPFCRRRRVAISIAAARSDLAGGVRSRCLGVESAAATAAVCINRGAIGECER